MADERIDKLVYQQGEELRPSTTEGEQTNLFLTGPAEFLCKRICEELRADPAWRIFFGDAIDAYKRMDYSMRALPALRVYVDRYKKEAETWYMNGVVTIDILFPASVRRAELEQIPSTISAALVQQFRRSSMFARLTERVPGLNELGKMVDVDKSLAFEWGEDMVPLTQLMLNFRMNLNAWDDYLESDDRTRDEPFIRTLADLKRIVLTIQGVTAETTAQLDEENGDGD